MKWFLFRIKKLNHQPPNKLLHIFCQQNQLPNMMKPPPAQSTKPHNFSGRFNPKKEKQSLTSWWLNQPIWKICSSKWESLPNRGENKQYLKLPPSWQPRNRRKNPMNAQKSDCAAQRGKKSICLCWPEKTTPIFASYGSWKKCQKSRNGGEWVKDGVFHDSWYKSVKKNHLSEHKSKPSGTKLEALVFHTVDGRNPAPLGWLQPYK